VPVQAEEVQKNVIKQLAMLLKYVVLALLKSQ
jgi:hypothetical protein